MAKQKGGEVAQQSRRITSSKDERNHNGMAIKRKKKKKKKIINRKDSDQSPSFLFFLFYFSILFYFFFPSPFYGVTLFIKPYLRHSPLIITIQIRTDGFSIFSFGRKDGRWLSRVSFSGR